MSPQKGFPQERSITEVELWSKAEDKPERVRVEPSDWVGGSRDAPSRNEGCDGSENEQTGAEEAKMTEARLRLSSRRGQGRVFGRMVGLKKGGHPKEELAWEKDQKCSMLILR